MTKRLPRQSGAREVDLLPVPYYHMVFTLPAPVADIAHQHKAVVYDLLFKVSASCDRRRSQASAARIGITSVLHSWGSALIHHPLFPLMLVGMGRAFTELRRFEEALVAGKEALRQNPSLALAYGCLNPPSPISGATPRRGRRRLIYLRSIPHLQYPQGSLGVGNQSNEKLLIDGLRKAGLPEWVLRAASQLIWRPMSSAKAVDGYGRGRDAASASVRSG